MRIYPIRHYKTIYSRSNQNLRSQPNIGMRIDISSRPTLTSRVSRSKGEAERVFKRAPLVGASDTDDAESVLAECSCNKELHRLAKNWPKKGQSTMLYWRR